MATLRREPEPDPLPANLERFRLGEWLDPADVVPADHADHAGLWRALRAFRRYLAAKRAWSPNDRRRVTLLADFENLEREELVRWRATVQTPRPPAGSRDQAPPSP